MTTHEEFIQEFIELAVRRAIDSGALFPFPLWWRDSEGVTTMEAIVDDRGGFLFRDRLTEAIKSSLDSPSAIVVAALDMEVACPSAQDGFFSDLVAMIVYRGGGKVAEISVIDYDNKVDPPEIRDPRISKFWAGLIGCFLFQNNTRISISF